MSIRSISLVRFCLVPCHAWFIYSTLFSTPLQACIPCRHSWRQTIATRSSDDQSRSQGRIGTRMVRSESSMLWNIIQIWMIYNYYACFSYEGRWNLPNLCSIIQIQMVKIIIQKVDNSNQDDSKVSYKSGCFYKCNCWMVMCLRNWMILNILIRVNILYNQNPNDCHCVMFLKVVHATSNTLLFRASCLALEIKMLWGGKWKSQESCFSSGSGMMDMSLDLWIFGWLVTAVTLQLYIIP